MILVILRMKVLTEKRKELSQTIISLLGSIRTKKGCRSCDLCQSLQNEDELCLLEEWETLENFRAYLKSELFKVVRGAMNLLEEPCDATAYTLHHSEGMGELMDEFYRE
jgi:quinol monooxygenase YgiN